MAADYTSILSLALADNSYSEIVPAVGCSRLGDRGGDEDDHRVRRHRRLGALPDDGFATVE